MSPTAHGEVVVALLHRRPEPGTVVRVARTALNWSQAELGRRCGYSASQVSRWETGRLPLRDVELLRTLADVLALPPAVFGLGDTTERASRTATTTGHRVGRVTTPPTEEDDPVRRRAFLQLAALTGSTFAWPATAGATEVDPAAALAGQLGDVLLGPAQSGAPAPAGVLAEALTVARQEFTACRYLPLASRLPALITAAEATAAQRVDPQVQRVLAESYNLATRALIKLEASGLEWLSADRALHAARIAEDSLTLVEAQRLVASVARRAGHHDRAQALTLAAASHLDVARLRPAPEHLAMYSTLHLSAAYAAARAGDRERAGDLLAEAEATANRLADDHDRHRALVANLVSHKVSAAYVLGDAGTALAHARSLPLAAIPTTERRARLLVDTAQAWAQWDKPGQAYRTLLAAERTAPGEVRTRNAVRRLVTVLMDSPKQATMPGLPALARRVHAVA
ncbi:MAG: helix-turn-helix domain-containing protein [Actinophytocola sp.]|uniref:helix-turn-helix domain-containing protein n=1 Tax=Actinophytocola sp. TaxID=1872138 RepID=UPI001323856A|nr:helix-turn-helix transcriptional regulator [Actinophytocola sp.]MPZ80303.1 helix-turn-helix domain-containing protein [Actinophytocola sp.]